MTEPAVPGEAMSPERLEWIERVVAVALYFKEHYAERMGELLNEVKRLRQDRS